jgi:uncharacterized protein (DUF1778 family)
VNHHFKFQKIDKYGKLPYIDFLHRIIGFTMPTQQSSLTARLEARISTDLHATLKRAAEIEGRTVTDFVIAAVQTAARRAIEQAEVIQLSLADQQVFAAALMKPPKANTALKKAFAHHRKLTNVV